MSLSVVVSKEYYAVAEVLLEAKPVTLRHGDEVGGAAEIAEDPLMRRTSCEEPWRQHILCAKQHSRVDDATRLGVGSGTPARRVREPGLAGIRTSYSVQRSGMDRDIAADSCSESRPINGKVHYTE